MADSPTEDVPDSMTRLIAPESACCPHGVRRPSAKTSSVPFVVTTADGTVRFLPALYGQPTDGTFGFAAVPIAAVLIAVLALGVERTVLRPMIGKPVFVVAIITIGVDVVVRVVTNAFIGLDVRQVGDPWGLNTVTLLGVEVQQRYLVMFGTTVAVVAVLFAFFRFSRVGLAMRAVAHDQEVALAQGISVGSVFALSWAIAGGLAALAGVFVATGAGVDQQLWVIALKALPAIILVEADQSVPEAAVWIDP